MNDEHIEVLMATYNGERFVAEQIDSIFNQTHQNLHLLIRDDCSKDRTMQILVEKSKQYPGRITIVPSEANLGVIGNFSALMEHSKSNYIMCADQDDVWLPNKITVTLEKLLSLEKTHGKQTPLLVHTDLRVVDQQLKEIAPSFWKYTHLNPQIPSLYKLLGQNVVTGCALMMNKALLKKALPIPVEATMHDHWIALVAMHFGKIEGLPVPTMLYRQHSMNQVGAQGGGLLLIIRNVVSNKTLFLERMRRSLRKQSNQAKTFSSRYGVTIPGFCEILEGGLFERVRLICRYGAIKNGFLKNLALLFIRI